LEVLPITHITPHEEAGCVTGLSMSNPPQKASSQLGELVGQILAELTFSEAGKDAGLMPINCLLLQVQDVITPLAGAVELQKAVAFARQWVDQSIGNGFRFTAEGIQRLQEWTAWMQSAASAIEGDHAVPPVPGQWTGVLAAPAEAASAASSIPATPVVDEELTLDIERDGELLREFQAESQEHLQNIELGVLALEEDPGDAETLHSIFRAYHTLKGSSGVLNLTPINHLAHEVESLLDRARQGKLAINSEITDVILQGGDLLKRFVGEIKQQLQNGRPPHPVVISTQGVIHKVRAILAVAPAGTAAARPHAVGTTAPTSAAPTGPTSPAQPAALMVKVDTRKVDSLVDLVGEIVIAQSLIMQDEELGRLRSDHARRNLARLGHITNELQRIAMSLRMVLIRPTFQKMVRLVRDTAVKWNKQVVLKMSGEDTELDRTIVDSISDPLAQLLRNAVEHGIESPEQRRAAGKPPQGTIHLSAMHQGGRILIQVCDDGAGLNKERILAKGVAAGLVRAGESLRDSEIYDLIFTPGFSTAETVKQVSGRNGGMDQVQRSIDKLGGHMAIESQAGRGTTFLIHLPLTLAIIDGLVAQVGAERYILPTLAVRELFRPTRSMLSTVCGRGEVVNVRGRLSPVIRLHEVFHLQPHTTDPCAGLLVMVGQGNRTRCLMVDDLIGKQEVVIKSLGDELEHTRGVAGATILGDGRIGLILDMDSLSTLTAAGTEKAA